MKRLSPTRSTVRPAGPCSWSQTPHPSSAKRSPPAQSRFHPRALSTLGALGGSSIHLATGGRLDPPRDLAPSLNEALLPTSASVPTELAARLGELAENPPPPCRDTPSPSRQHHHHDNTTITLVPITHWSLPPRAT